MRLSELAQQSGTSIPTIKFYIREGLLPAGRTTTHLADYTEAHLERLRLVRALVDVGGLSLAAVGDILAALSRPGGIDEAISMAHGALGPRPAATAPFTRAEAVIDQVGWTVDRDSAPMAQLEAALAALEAVGLPLEDDRVLTYARAAMAVAERDVAGTHEDLAADPDPEVALRDVVLGTVLYEPLLLSLRRLAQPPQDRAGHNRRLVRRVVVTALDDHDAGVESVIAQHLPEALRVLSGDPDLIGVSLNDECVEVLTTPAVGQVRRRVGRGVEVGQVSGGAAHHYLREWADEG